MRRELLGLVSAALLITAANCSDGETSNQDDGNPMDSGVFGGTGGTDAGAGGTGGNGATGGTMVSGCADVEPDSDFPLLDDFEDGDTAVNPAPGREGFWFSLNDMSAGGIATPDTPFEPTPGGTSGSLFTAEAGGEGFNIWGFGLATTLVWTNDQINCPYDASLFAGVSFAARGNASGNRHLEVALPIEEQVPTEFGGTCDESTTTCWDVHLRGVQLHDTWHRYSIPWSEFRQLGFGEVSLMDPATLLQMQFLIRPPSQPASFAIDDIRFTMDDSFNAGTPIEDTGSGGGPGAGGAGGHAGADG